MTLRDTDLLTETEQFNADFAAANPFDRTVPPSPETLTALRRNRMGSNEPVLRLPQGHDRTIEGVGVRVFRPDNPRGVYLHIHGGGWSFGSADGQDERLWRIATEAGLAVVSVEYRLAPEHPLPAGSEDCLAVAYWLVKNVEAEFGTDRLLIGGESAGANLSVLTLLGLRDRYGVTGRFLAAHLLFGVYDLSMTPSQRLFGSRPLLSNTDSLRVTYDMVLPGLTPEERRSPQFSPLYADLTGLPPARFVVGTEDPLLDDTLFLAARWRQAGLDTRLDLVAGAMHGFTLFPLAVTEREQERQVEYLRVRSTA